MSYKVGNIFVSCPEEPQRCEFCGKIAETRPYTDGGLEICFECAQKPEYKKMVDENFGMILDGKSRVMDRRTKH